MTQAPARPATVSAAAGPAAGFGRGLAALYAAQLAQARAARVPLLFVATLQSVGILLLLRGVARHADEPTRVAVVSGATVLVVGFVAVNLLAQRLAGLRAAGALDYYACLPVPPAAVVLGLAAGYATVAVPGAVLTALVGTVVFGLPYAHLWLLAPVLLVSGAALAGTGGVLGLWPRRPEVATVAGQLGMTAVLFAGVISPHRLPLAWQVLRDVVPSTWAVDALSGSFSSTPDWSGVAWRLAVGLAVAAVTLTAATWAYRRAVAG